MGVNHGVIPGPDAGVLLEMTTEIGERLVSRNQTVTTVESCTGGGVAYTLTRVPGSSRWFHRGFVTYDNRAKSAMVNVPADLIAAHGAVSLEVAAAMVRGTRDIAGADYGISITGIAGPDGGSASTPVGTVCFGWLSPGGRIVTERRHFEGDRDSVRIQSIHYALGKLLDLVGQDD
ncbi:MAG: CinA family protein [Gammaproteobacteria bacterium]|nr:CinA family protein [Gammaproteobacteria bacterium]